MASRNGFRSHGLLNDNQDVLRTFSYYPGVDKPHSVMTDSATYYYATDPTGSVIGLAEFDGAASVNAGLEVDRISGLELDTFSGVVLRAA